MMGRILLGGNAGQQGRVTLAPKTCPARAIRGEWNRAHISEPGEEQGRGAGGEPQPKFLHG